MCCLIAKLCLTLQSHALQHGKPLFSTIFWSLLQFMSFESVMPSVLSSATLFYPPFKKYISFKTIFIY